MGKYKEYVIDLATRIGKNFEDVTSSDIEFDFMQKAQSIWSDSNSDYQLKEDNKKFLPKISISLLKDGIYNIGDVYIQDNILNGSKYYYLVV